MKDQKDGQEKPTWDMVGKLRYLVDRTRPDLAYAASFLGRFTLRLHSEIAAVESSQPEDKKSKKTKIEAEKSKSFVAPIAHAEQLSLHQMRVIHQKSTQRKSPKQLESDEEEENDDWLDDDEQWYVENAANWSKPRPVPPEISRDPLALMEYMRNYKEV